MPQLDLQFQQFFTFPTLNLAENSVHIITLEINSLCSAKQELLSKLQQDEIVRMERFSKPELAERYGVVRGMLRKLIEHYLNQPAKDLIFSYNAHGKPTIVASRSTPSLFFNVSHSKEMATYAITAVGRIGIDIQYNDPSRHIDSLAHYICSQQELESYRRLTNDKEKLRAFYTLWTRKEAFAKGDGQGLSMGMRQIHIGFDQRAANEIYYKDRLQGRWIVQDIPSNSPDYQLAVAVEFAE